VGVPPAVRAAAVGIALLLTLVACGSIPERPARLGHSSYGCMTRTVQQHLPAGLSDKSAHCLAAGLIARYCSTGEARLAALGKELRDLFGRGDASGADWNASRIGIGCAQRAQDDEALRICCEKTAAPVAGAAGSRGWTYLLPKSKRPPRTQLVPSSLKPMSAPSANILVK
jgi:hypothetical protein